MNRNLSEVGDAFHPVLDEQRLIQLMGPKKYRANAIIGILTNVIASGCAPIKDARNALERQQIAQAAHVIHNLKGCIANLGGIRVFEIAKHLETQLEAGLDHQCTLDSLTLLEDELTAYTAAAKDWLLSAKIPIMDEATPSLNEMQLQQFKIFLQDNNILACDEFEQMRASLQYYLNVDKFKALNCAMEVLDFKTALAQLETP